MNPRHETIAQACSALGKGAVETARAIISDQYPFSVIKKQGRNYSNREKLRVFRRDGFTDRCSGDKMVFPPVLRVLSTVFPAASIATNRGDEIIWVNTLWRKRK